MSAAQKKRKRSKKSQKKELAPQVETISSDDDDNEFKMGSSIWVQTIVGFILLNVAMGIIFALAIYTSQTIAIVTAVFLGLAICIFGTMRWGMGMIYAGILAMSLGSGAAMYVVDFYQVTTASIAENVSIADFDKHPKAKVFIFKDGTVRPDLGGFHISVFITKDQAHRSETKYYVAPIVPEGWKKGDPVFLWATAQSMVPDTWKKKAATGFPVNPLHRDYFVQAAYNAKDTHGLKFEKVQFVRWVESYDKGMADRR